MQPPVLKRFLVEDYPNAPIWFGRFLQILNQFMEQTVRVLNKNVAFGENIQSSTFSTTFTTDAGYATGDFTPISFAWFGTALPIACLVTRIEHNDSTPFLGNVGVIQWRYGNGGLNVLYIPGLVAGTKYTVTFLAY